MWITLLKFINFSLKMRRLRCDELVLEYYVVAT